MAHTHTAGTVSGLHARYQRAGACEADEGSTAHLLVDRLHRQSVQAATGAKATLRPELYGETW